MMKVVVLDGDGVINNIAAHDIQSAAEWKPLPGSLEAIAKLCQGGCRVFIAANYGGIGRGLLDYDTLFAMFERLQKLVSEMGGRIDGIFFAPEHPDQASEMRKPNPGMLQDLARRLQLNLDEMVMVGDGASDLDAALAAGVRPVLVRSGKGRRTEAEHHLKGVTVCDDLAAFAAQWLATHGPHH
jgi:D-glycero-D-manno-heptose 1,7-bisphosphate phosphatase